MRLCSLEQNNQNARIRKDNVTGYKGVRVSGKKFEARIKCGKRLMYLGRYPNPIEAAKAYNEAAKKYFGEYAWLNPV